MPAFLDLNGASGATYRFRLAPGGNVTTPIAGNYACVREDEAGFTVLSIAATNDLSSATAEWKRCVAKYGATHLYTRLNVSSLVRENEQRDIAAFYKPRLNRQSA